MDQIDALFEAAGQLVDLLALRIGPEGQKAVQTGFSARLWAQNMQKQHQTILNQLADEQTELVQAANKLRRMQTVENQPANPEMELLGLDLDDNGADANDFIDLDGLDMGSNLDELDLNLLDLPEGDQAQEGEPVDMDELYNLIGLN